jgi:hypothetical protein
MINLTMVSYDATSNNYFSEAITSMITNLIGVVLMNHANIITVN